MFFVVLHSQPPLKPKLPTDWKSCTLSINLQLASSLPSAACWDKIRATGQYMKVPTLIISELQSHSRPFSRRPHFSAHRCWVPYFYQNRSRVESTIANPALRVRWRLRFHNPMSRQHRAAQQTHMISRRAIDTIFLARSPRYVNCGSGSPHLHIVSDTEMS